MRCILILKKKFSILFYLIFLLIFLLINFSQLNQDFDFTNLNISTDTGAKNPSIAETIDRDGKQAWSNPDNAKTSGDIYANIDITNNQYTDWLRLTDFSLGIPVGATINGIVIEIEHYGEGIISNIEEHSCRLVLDRVIKGDEKMTLNNDIPTNSDPDSYESYGAIDDDWNGGLTVANLNNVLFGVQISYWNDHNTQSRNVYVDNVRIIIYYTEAGGETNSPTWDTLIESADPLELGNYINISIKVYDESNISNVYIEIDNVNYTMLNITNTYFYSNWLPNRTGIIDYKIWMIDNYGNTNLYEGSILVQNTPYIVLSLIILFSLLIIMVVLYTKIRVFLIILTVFLFSLIFGIFCIIDNVIPFTPYFQLFFLLFQGILFLLTSLDYKEANLKN